MAQGPAIRQKLPPPMGTPPTDTTVSSGWCWREARRHTGVSRFTSATWGSASRCCSSSVQVGPTSVSRIWPPLSARAAPMPWRLSWITRERMAASGVSFLMKTSIYASENAAKPRVMCQLIQYSMFRGDWQYGGGGNRNSDTRAFSFCLRALRRSINCCRGGQSRPPLHIFPSNALH